MFFLFLMGDFSSSSQLNFAALHLVSYSAGPCQATLSSREFFKIFVQTTNGSPQIPKLTRFLSILEKTVPGKKVDPFPSTVQQLTVEGKEEIKKQQYLQGKGILP